MPLSPRSMTTSERLADCANLTTCVPLSGAPLTLVTLLVAIPGGLQRGQVLGVLPEEAIALRAAGIAS